MKLFWGILVFIAVVFFPPQAFADAIAWTNNGPDNSFENGLNWTTATAIGTVPGPSDNAYIFPGFTAAPQLVDIGIVPSGGTRSTINITATDNESVQSLLVTSNFDGLSVNNGILNLTFSTGNTFNIGTGGITLSGGTTVNYAGNLQLAGLGQPDCRHLITYFGFQ